MWNCVRKFEWLFVHIAGLALALREEADKVLMLGKRTEDTSYWTATTPMPVYEPLSQTLDVDVVIVGGGVTGITAAHLLKQRGKRVVLLERDRCGGGQSGRTTAHLTAVTDTPLSHLVERVGIGRAKSLWDAGFAAIARIRAEVRDERINCDFGWVRGCLHASTGQDLASARLALGHETTVANALGIAAVYTDHVPGFGRPGVWFEGQARLHPLRYLSVLLDRIDGEGSRVCEHTRVDEIDLVRRTVRARGVTLAPRYIVVATHVPQACPMHGLAVALPPVDLVTSYVISGVAPHGAIDEGIYWEHREPPYEYLRVDRHEHHDTVIFGGVDHANSEGASSDRFARLERRLAQHAPRVRIEHRWSGLIAEPADGRPYIGEIADGVFAATGYGGNGMTFGTLAGMMAADAACGDRNPWHGLFDFNRANASDGSWSPSLANRDAASRHHRFPHPVT